MNPTQLQALSLARNEIWAILPEYFEARLHSDLAESILEAASGAPDRLAVSRPGPKSGGVARVPIIGSITHRDSFWSLFLGGTGATVERLTQTLRGLATDPAVSTVMLEVDSPGGTVSGIPELAAEVRALAEQKHVVALVNSLCASAAYWIAAMADEIVAVPEAMTGSIGVFTVHDDFSKMMEEAGIKTTYISAGKFKTEANPDEPLSDEARAHLQTLVDSAYSLFVGDVAKGRGVTPAQVRSDYGQGRVLTSADAKAAGMIDRIATADETLRRLAGRHAETVGNSQALSALMRRRLEIAQSYFQEESNG